MWRHEVQATTRKTWCTVCAPHIPAQSAPKGPARGSSAISSRQATAQDLPLVLVPQTPLSFRLSRAPSSTNNDKKRAFAERSLPINATCRHSSTTFTHNTTPSLGKSPPPPTHTRIYHFPDLGYPIIRGCAVCSTHKNRSNNQAPPTCRTRGVVRTVLGVPQDVCKGFLIHAARVLHNTTRRHGRKAEQG